MQGIARPKVRIARSLVALLFAMLPASWAGFAWAAPSDADQQKAPKIFSTEAPLALTLTAPWHEFMRTKSDKKRYPGTLEYLDESGAKRSFAVAFEPRGKNRLKTCKFPPIKLIFDKQAVEGTPFRGNKSLKLTTLCDNGERYEHYIVKEMLAYRIYNLVTELSFKVRPLSVTYVDGQTPAGPRIGFLVEDDSAMAKRNNLEKIDIARPSLAQLDSLQANRFALFEYLIGNTDFANLAGPTIDKCCHNSELIGENPQAKLFVVPYDFDSSGLVDAPYATPSPVLKINSNRERVYRGFCANNATIETARGEFVRLEPQVLALARAEDRLDSVTRQSAVDYLSKGFEVLRDDDKFGREITAKCRK